MNLKRITTGALITILISSNSSLLINAAPNQNANANASKKLIISEETNNFKNTSSRALSKQELSNKKLPSKTSSHLNVKKVNIYDDGTISGELTLHTKGSKKEDFKVC